MKGGYEGRSLIEDKEGGGWGEVGTGGAVEGV